MGFGEINMNEDEYAHDESNLLDEYVAWTAEMEECYESDKV